MKFARWVFLIAGIYGVLVIGPMYFFEAQIAQDDPPAITHPEFFYGFVGVALSWQIAFLIMSLNPIRYRWLMIPAILEKATFGIAAWILFFQQRASGMLAGFGIIDLILGMLFLVAFWRTGTRFHTPPSKVT